MLNLEQDYKNTFSNGHPGFKFKDFPFLGMNLEFYTSNNINSDRYFRINVRSYSKFYFYVDVKQPDSYRFEDDYKSLTTLVEESFEKFITTFRNFVKYTDSIIESNSYEQESGYEHILMQMKEDEYSYQKHDNEFDEVISEEIERLFIDYVNELTDVRPDYYINFERRSNLSFRLQDYVNAF